ncbi:hypothetical protein NBRC116494_32560 [Aurantivibrio plasticivorans]
MRDHKKTSSKDESSGAPLNLALSESQVRLWLQAVIDSGVLGRSKVYVELLQYFVDSACRGHIPKEIELAIEVLHKSTDFDVAKDSSVRVYIHQLRKKIDNYFEKYDQYDGYVIKLPKGQYQLVATPYSKPLSLSAGDSPPRRHSKLLIPLLLCIVILLGVNISYLFFEKIERDALPYTGSMRESIFWQPLIDSNAPILLVLGDYYIFGELDRAGNISRMVREFDVNSANDLEVKLIAAPELSGRYYDLDLTYVPEGGALALNSILPQLHSLGRPVHMKMMSTLSVADIRENNIIYIGYVSGLAKLRSFVFAASHFTIGENYDELLEKNSGESYVSDAGLPAKNRAFVDYGLISRIALGSDVSLYSVSGLRDAGLTEAADIIMSDSFSEKLKKRIGGQAASASLEVLIEVRGMDRSNFSSSVLRSELLDSDSLWESSEVPSSLQY